MSLTQGPVLRLVRRATLVLAAVNGVVLASILILVMLSRTYWENVWYGPFPIDTTALLRPDLLESLTHWFVTVDGRVHPGGPVDVDYDKSVWRFYVLEVGDRLLLVKTFADRPLSGTVSGVLDWPPFWFDDRVLPELGSHEPGLESRLLPFYLRADAFQPNGQDMTWLLALAALLCLINLTSAALRTAWPGLHPSVRRLRRYGDAARVADDIGSEIETFEVFTVSESWLVWRGTFGFEAWRLDDLEAVEEMRASANVARESVLRVRPKGGTARDYRAREGAVGEALDEIRCRAPHLLG